MISYIEQLTSYEQQRIGYNMQTHFGLYMPSPHRELFYVSRVPVNQLYLPQRLAEHTNLSTSGITQKSIYVAAARVIDNASVLIKPVLPTASESITNTAIPFPYQGVIYNTSIATEPIHNTKSYFSYTFIKRYKADLTNKQIDIIRQIDTIQWAAILAAVHITTPTNPVAAILRTVLAL